MRKEGKRYCRFDEEEVYSPCKAKRIVIGAPTVPAMLTPKPEGKGSEFVDDDYNPLLADVPGAG